MQKKLKRQNLELITSTKPRDKTTLDFMEVYEQAEEDEKSKLVAELEESIRKQKN